MKFQYLMYLLVALNLVLTPNIAFANKAASVGQQSFNDGWLFYKGKVDGAQLASYDDSHWQGVILPHDWAIEGPFEPKYNARNGGLPFHGTGWYRKSFKLPNSAKGKVVSITFDGVMYNAHVYINGKLLGNRPFGYIGFEYDLSEHVHFGDIDNVIAVSMSPEDLSSRWYPGAGIYRDTWLAIKEPTHIKQWSTFVHTPTVSKQQATVAVSLEVINGGNHRAIDVVTEVIDKVGKVVAANTQTLNTNSAQTKGFSTELTLNGPTLWDISHPYVYQVTNKLVANGEVLATETSPLGVRSLKFTSDDGFHLNGRRVQIQGVCLHHDNGPLGAVANRRAIERKLEIMKSMGVNAIRTAHNPPSPLLAELADEMGILLQVESFDVWKTQKQMVHNSYNKYFDDWHEVDLRDTIKQFRNHPSVIMWSTGNEIMEQGQKDGHVITKRLTAIAHDEDPTRLVSAGFNNSWGALKHKLAHNVDIPGFNYRPLLYGDIHEKHPEWPLLASETSSITSTRGKYHLPMEKYNTHDSRYVSSYDIIGPPWAYPPDIEFDALAQTPAVMGEFIWTGFDYLGEPTPYGGKDHSGDGYWNKDWPVRSSSFGAVDLVGFPKDRYYLYQSQWTTKPMVHVLPHWNWQNYLGQTIPVFAYTNAEEVELFVNGKSMGRKVKGVDKAELPVSFNLWRKQDRSDYKSPYRLRWDVTYQPGNIEVVAYTKGKAVARKQVFTAGKPAALTLSSDRTELSADGYDLSYISVSVVDKDGHLVPDAENNIRFFVEGAGEIAAVGNGDSATLAPFKADYRRAFSGKAMLIVKTKKGETGKIKVRAYSEHLKGQSIELRSY
ncbi:glycoside hydrolase family 2 TIM barrel-domain containing protein [Paraferrimonas sp. SM1919]|uniref:glycoside hydrolase family 2 TIM barrel-domain containing protein n=1 Tax=Paraferrimonas sp. SM1919 TaxID=2662263 RepID=UPI001F099211|nr:glycoside hydrolase family 2 TIM barrel-domain containing protein [Paraferrimonas sp. SM1919]